MRALDALLRAIYASNRWYDALDEHHGVLRFMLCLIPLMGCNIMIIWHNAPWLNIAGLVILCALAFWRVIPIFFPHPSKSRRDSRQS